jgi:OPA family glycerol-3-phosphate transporter-like MFS transporter
VRQGLLLYFTEFLKEVHHVDLKSWTFTIASTGITVGGIMGGLLCGWMSDKLFGSRRAPVAFIFYCMQVVGLLALGITQDPLAAAILIGFCCMWIFGVHGMLSGTASMDFGGRKAAATAAGFLDGIQYVASGFTGFGLGWVLKTYGWDGTPGAEHQAANAHIWTYSIIPFSVLGGLIILRLWNAHPSKGTAH